MLESSAMTTIPISGALLEADEQIPNDAAAVVMIADGRSMSWLDSHNRTLARALRDNGMGTVIVDLLSTAEAVDPDGTLEDRIDPAMQARRLMEIFNWLERRYEPFKGQTGLIGLNAGAAAALTAAGNLGARICGAVGIAGRPERAGNALEMVAAPTLLIAGGDERSRDSAVRALKRLHCEKELRLFPGITSPLEEANSLRQASDLAAAWIHNHLLAQL